MDTTDTLTIEVLDAYELDNLTVELLTNNKAFKEAMEDLKGYTGGALERLHPMDLEKISTFLADTSYRCTIDQMLYIARIAFIELS